MRYAKRFFVEYDWIHIEILCCFIRRWGSSLCGRTHLPTGTVADSLNKYILSALQEKDLKYFSFFLHHYEPQLNKRIKAFLGVDGGNLYDTDRFLDIKLSCREQMLQKLMEYNPAKGAEYATYIYPFIRDAMLRFRMGEEKRTRIPRKRAKMLPLTIAGTMPTSSGTAYRLKRCSGLLRS